MYISGQWSHYCVYLCSINANDLRKFLTKINNKTLQGRFRQVFQVRLGFCAVHVALSGPLTS